MVIKESEIHGLGLFAAENISSGTVFGISHVMDDRFENNYIRTPLGGFYNHSEEPNCETYRLGEFTYLKATRDIGTGEEITCYYTLYPIVAAQ